MKEEKRFADLALDRRQFINGLGLAGIGLPAILAGLPARAGEPKGPNVGREGGGPHEADVVSLNGSEDYVFLNYTRKELDFAYSQLHWVNLSIKQIIERSVRLSKAARDQFEYRTFSYGKHPDETLDVFMSDRKDTPIHVFLHGGTWRKLTKDENSFPASTFVNAGAHYIAVNFSNIPSVRLPDMVDQVRRAVAWIHAHAKSFGGDPERIYVSGHSSGGHLAAAVLTTDWSRYANADSIVRGGLCISGMYDLYPVQKSFRGDYLHLSEQEVGELSPGRHLEQVCCPIIVANGTAETPEFQRQAAHFAADLEARAGEHRHQTVIGTGLNHFDMWFSLSHPGSAMGRVALAQMGLASA